MCVGLSLEGLDPVQQGRYSAAREESKGILRERARDRGHVANLGWLAILAGWQWAAGVTAVRGGALTRNALRYSYIARSSATTL